MIICGIKMTHDSAIALIDNGKLVCCYELEKINNRHRHALLDNFSQIAAVLEEYGYKMTDVDRFVIDGWDSLGEAKIDDAPLFRLAVKVEEEWEGFTLARYGHLVDSRQDVLEHITIDKPSLNFTYHSYMHVSGHIFSAYCTSPFAVAGENAFVLVWDGGMFPQLFYFRSSATQVENLGPVTCLNGNVYALFAQQFSPFKEMAKDQYDLSIAGKVMAYIGHGKPDMALLDIFNRLFEDPEIRALDSVALVRYFMDMIPVSDERTNADLMATFDKFLEAQLLAGLHEKLQSFPGYEKQLCYAGGCALNIKWNSVIRSSGLFNKIWIPPFPNDSGSAIGTACCEMVKYSACQSLQWNVYSGPPVSPVTAEVAWEQISCGLKQLAGLLYQSGQPVVMLNGRAELGPRSLGNRSILANPASLRMKDILNEIKEREGYRPVAPVCMEDTAGTIFTPGTPDPLMLYDHMVKSEWLNRIPAVCHVDGSARLQTVNRDENNVLYELLSEYSLLSGIPLLCNTSANFKGRGFFPCVNSVIKWGKVDFVWHDYVLYFSKHGKTFLNSPLLEVISMGAG
jgi:carbamoyltransferase